MRRYRMNHVWLAEYWDPYEIIEGPLAFRLLSNARAYVEREWGMRPGEWNVDPDGYFIQDVPGHEDKYVRIYTAPIDPMSLI